MISRVSKNPCPPAGEVFVARAPEAANRRGPITPGKCWVAVGQAATRPAGCSRWQQVPEVAVKAASAFWEKLAWPEIWPLRAGW